MSSNDAQKTIQLPKDQKIMIAVPTIDGKIEVDCMISIMKCMEFCKRHGVNTSFIPLAGDSLICRARCILAHAFYKSKENYTHMFFVDSDIGFQEQLLIKLLIKDRPLVAACYPKKSYTWPGDRDPAKDFETVHKRPLKSFQDLAPGLLNYNVNFLPSGGQVNQGFVDVLDAATGLMLIRRDCIERLDKEEHYVVNDLADMTLANHEIKKGCKYLNLFPVMVDPVTKRLLSEDYAFCRLVQLAGLPPVAMLIDHHVVHKGQCRYQGNFADKLLRSGALKQRQPEPAAPPAPTEDEGRLSDLD